MGKLGNKVEIIYSGSISSEFAFTCTNGAELQCQSVRAARTSGDCGEFVYAKGVLGTIFIHSFA